MQVKVDDEQRVAKRDGLRRASTMVRQLHGPVWNEIANDVESREAGMCRRMGKVFGGEKNWGVVLVLDSHGREGREGEVEKEVRAALYL